MARTTGISHGPSECRLRDNEIPARGVRSTCEELPAPPRRRVFVRPVTRTLLSVRLPKQETGTGMDMLRPQDASATTTACDFGLLDSSTQRDTPTTTRKPLLLFELAGLLLLRLAARQLAGLLFNDPPRNTRAPGHHVPAAFTRRARSSRPNSNCELKACSKSRAGKMLNAWAVRSDCSAASPVRGDRQ